MLVELKDNELESVTGGLTVWRKEEGTCRIITTINLRGPSLVKAPTDVGHPDCIPPE